jgi:adenosylcobinamide-GDP ribazoletransferase
MNARWRLLPAAPRFLPLVGALIGAIGGGVYWVGAQIWPTSIAVVLSMLATALLPAGAGAGLGAAAGVGAGATVGAGARTGEGAPASNSELLGFVFGLLMKFNALMALSAANLPYPLPANVALGVIMVAAHASSRALVVSVLASPTRAASKPASVGDLGIALGLGFAPAALIGIPGLVGLAAAIVARILFIAYRRRKRLPITVGELDTTQQLTEVCFYLGALATWAYV